MRLAIFGIILFQFSQGYGQDVAIRASPTGPVSTGATVTITCAFPNVTSVPTSMTWSHDSDQAESILWGGRFDISHRKTVPPETSITIRRANDDDAGIWKCTGRFFGAQRGNSETKLEGRYLLIVGAPRIEYLSDAPRVSIGDSVSLYCNASGDPNPSITWSRVLPAITLPAGEKSLGGEELSFKVGGIPDHGVYQCNASNAIGTVNRTVRVNVNHAPFFIDQRPSVVRGFIGVPLALSVTISSFPLPSVTWYKEGIAVDAPRVSALVARDGTHALQFSPHGSDFGRYTCVAVNEYGRSVHSLVLVPDGPPASPSSVIPKLVTMTSVRLKIVNGLQAGGVPITKYRVMYRQFGTTLLHNSRYTSSDVIILRGLQAGKMYIIYISAGNQAGWSGYAKALYVTTRRIPLPTTSVPVVITPIRKSTTSGPVTVAVDRTTQILSPNTSTAAAPPIQTTDQETIVPTRAKEYRTTSRGTPLSGYPSIVGAFLPNSGSPDTNDTVGTVPADGPSEQRSAIVTVCLVLAAIVCMMVIGFCLFMTSSIPINRWTKRRKHSTDNMDQSFYDENESMDFEEPVQYKAGTLPKLINSLLSSPPSNFEFPSEGIVIGNLIGQGSFGVVFDAEAFGILEPNVGTDVAVKTLKEDCTEDHKLAFQKELEVMTRLKPHPFLVTLLGCCATSDVQLIIMERLAEGNLLTHLRQTKQHITNHVTRRVSMRTTLSPCELTKYGYEIANGMAHLASMKCIHRDLAARNILLSLDGVCKLTDFNLARDVMKDGISQRRTQGRSSLRWMALESLLENVFTIRSNVWSFGVVLWEIVTIGSYPYGGITSSKLTRHLTEGNRMGRPDHCSQEIYSLMTQCWQGDPKKRPKFDELSKKLESTLTQSRNYIILEELGDCIYECAS